MTAAARLARLAGWAGLVLLLDQLSKVAVRESPALHPGRIVVWPGVFELVHSENPGAAFGMFGEAEHRLYLFGAVALLSLVAGIWTALRFGDLPGVAAVTGVLLGGALGNSLDRFTRGSVTDFLVFQAPPGPLRAAATEAFGTHRWPAFNIADIGVVLAFLIMLPLTVRLFGPEEESLPPLPPEPGPPLPP